MRAIIVREPGDETVLQLGDAPPPALGPAEIRIRVRATAVNRADLLQRQGMYPPPPGASEILGMECAGDVIEMGPGAVGLRPGERVMALLPGGGYAEEACVDHGSVIPLPDGMSYEEGGAFPCKIAPDFVHKYSNGGQSSKCQATGTSTRSTGRPQRYSSVVENSSPTRHQ